MQYFSLLFRFLCYNNSASGEYGLVAQLGERLGQLYSLSHGGMYLTRQPRGSHPFVESLDKSAFLIEYGGVAQLGERTVRIRKVKGSNPSVSTTICPKTRFECEFSGIFIALLLGFHQKSVRFPLTWPRSGP